MLTRAPAAFALVGLLAAAGLTGLTGCDALRSHRASPAHQQRISGPLRVSAINPRYFADTAGRVVYVTGSHTWEDLQDGGTHDPPPVFDYERFLNTLAAEGHNFVRVWRWEQVRGNAGTSLPFWLSPTPYARSGPGLALDGKPRFDLTKFNDVYFQRLRERLRLAQRKGIYASVMLFDGWSIGQERANQGNPWLGHPFNRLNNVNGIDGDPNHDDAGTETHTLEIPGITALQEAYVRKVVDEVNDLDNVLYEISNESPRASTEWQYHMIRYLKQYEATKPKQHPVGMTAEFPDGANAALFASPADWIALNSQGDPMTDPMPADGRKVLIDDTDHLCGICGSTEWAWISFLRGRNPLFMDPYEGEDGVTTSFQPRSRGFESLRHNLGFIRSYADRVDLAKMTPHPELASTRYCLADPDSSRPEYLAYIPGGLRPSVHGLRVSIDLRAVRGRFAAEWFSPRFERVVATDSVEGGATRDLRAPFPVGDAVLYLHR
ncbi:MAG TPA: DUF6298 domain-containing protein [Gemmatimonadaceae bacterium]|jgi:hypothetical protein|nr:DUF6298 domain-containing protein [Gemmatimonadaceae bacterium]